MGDDLPRRVRIRIISPELEHALSSAIAVERLLVACDYDGTLAEIVDNPNDAAPLDSAMTAIRRLIDLPGVEVAVITGRSLTDLQALAPFDDRVHRIGSHGSESVVGAVEGFDNEAAVRLAELDRALSAAADTVPGAMIERKPASVAFHYRGADSVAAPAAVEAVLAGPLAGVDLRVKHGKSVIELVVVDADKGAALRGLRRRLEASSVIFVGDDVTDEDAFAVLLPGDVGIKVGDGPTLAEYRLADPSAVAEVLRLVADRRTAASPDDE